MIQMGNLKKMTGLLIFSVAILTIASCNSKSSKTIVRISVLGSIYEVNAYKAISAKYMKIHPDVVVKIESVQGGDRRTKLMTQFAGNNAPDLIDTHYNWVHDFARKGVLQDLSEYMEYKPIPMWDDYFPVSKVPFKYKGKQYGIPIRCSAICMIYNKDKFNKYHVPYPSESWTWTDFEKSCKIMTRDENNDGRLDSYGFQTELSWEYFVPWIRMAGGKVLNRDKTRFLFNSPQARAVLNMFSHWYHIDHIMPHPTETMGLSPFTSGLTAIDMQGPWRMPQYNRVKSLHWDVNFIPRNPRTGLRITGFGGTGFCMWAGSKNKNKVWDVLRFLMSKESMEYKAKSPGNAEMPAARAVAYSPIIIKPDTPYHEEYFVKSIEFAQPEPQVDNSLYMTGIVNQEMEKMFSINQSADVTAANMARRVDAFLKSGQR